MFAKINGIKLAYQLDGPKGRPAVTFVHGFPFNRSTWKGQVAAIKKEFRVLSYDLRGQGQSTLGPAPQPLEVYADDLLALLDHLKLERVGLAGLSMGGYIALRALQKAPQRFWGLVLCDSKSDPDTDEGRLGRAAGMKTLRGKGGVKAFSEGMLPKLLADPKGKAGAALLKVMLANKAPGMANALAAMQGRTDTGAVLDALAVPGLILVGEKDLITPPAVAQAMAARNPRLKLAVLPGAGHVSNLEAPEAFNAALLAFLREAHPA
jgi:pimeloyl-ACP methyl ester carboxylesterase